MANSYNTPLKKAIISIFGHKNPHAEKRLNSYDNPLPKLFFLKFAGGQFVYTVQLLRLNGYF